MATSVEAERRKTVTIRSFWLYFSSESDVPAQPLIYIQIHKAGTGQPAFAEPCSLPAQVINHGSVPPLELSQSTKSSICIPLGVPEVPGIPKPLRNGAFPALCSAALHSAGTAAPAASAAEEGSSLPPGRKNTRERELCHGAACCSPWGKHFTAGAQATGHSQVWHPSSACSWRLCQDTGNIHPTGRVC